MQVMPPSGSPTGAGAWPDAWWTSIAGDEVDRFDNGGPSGQYSPAVSRLKVLVVASVVVAAIAAGVLFGHRRERFKAGDCIQLVRLTVVDCADGDADHVVLGVEVIEEDAAGGYPCGAWPQTNTDLVMDGPGGRPIRVCMQHLSK
ncbi:hypothetical protein Daura_31820 [Dactylosporangium aurantiacum]|uniref:Uncharacterized protein n=1 Tax=Dactylosporangium aurantiacum TaxID=35754 RepID=A0A9Q9MIW2_9ACTN|nr:hypothetical protein [Dactylosporangium aurantiacum]MDG6110076.1 hypothetical protein [Dactylosporangium aurantiacum]UWZ51327.1 hypothetical protein Daura_31820 [Dactylosporangium aurantiacum]